MKYYYVLVMCFIVITVKIAICAGQLYFSMIKHSFLMIGNPIWDVKRSGDLCGPGDIIISNLVLNYLRKGEYQTATMTDNEHLKVSCNRRWHLTC